MDKMLWQCGDPFKVILWYRYVPIEDVDALIALVRAKCESLGLLGRVLLSKEGMNGTLAGSEAAIDAFIDYLTNALGYHHIDWKHHLESARCDALPFLQLSVREVKEIISCGPQRETIDRFVTHDPDSYGGLLGSGVHLSPEEFDAVLERERDKCVVLDIRNEFEYDIGHFDSARSIGTFTYAETFKALDDVVAEQQKLDGAEERKESDKKILMYCTGGIRCEKASAYLRAKGLNNVYQLQGGIHRYLESFPDGGKFLGKNFVFDSRVAVSGEHAARKGAEESAHMEGNFSLGGSAQIVGRCIDCDAQHDVYSGFIVCTVCRMPVLVCDKCVESNPHPGEYYCSRHRDLKNIYFTVLERYSREELEEQKRALSAMLQRCLELSEEERKGASEGAKRESSPSLETPLDDGSKETHDPITHSKRRRQTLRKQIQKIEERVAALDRGAAVVAGDKVNPKVKDGWGFWRS